MSRPGRRGLFPAALIASVLVFSACAAPMNAAAPATPATSEPRQPVSSLLLGNRLLAAREPDLAMKAYLTSMNVEGISAEAMTGAGIAAQQQGLLTSARRYFEQARRLAPDSATAHNNLGVVLYMLKEYYPARNAFRTAYALSSGKSEMAERNLNRTEEAIALLEEVDEADPAISHDLIRLGTSEFRLIEATSPEAEVMAE